MTIADITDRQTEAALSGRMGVPWLPAEDDRLLELLGDVPRQMVHQEMHRSGRINGWPLRTPKAIDIRTNKLGMTFKSYGSWLSPVDIAAILGIHSPIVLKWIKNHDDLPAKRIGRLWFVRRGTLRQWAKRPQNQRHFGGIQLDRLVMLLEDRELAEQILERHPTRGTRTKVKCLETGKTYQSIVDAAAAHFVSHPAIWHGLREHRAVAGYHFEVIR